MRTKGKFFLEFLLVGVLLTGTLAVRHIVFAQGALPGGSQPAEAQPFIQLPPAEKFGLEQFTFGTGDTPGTEQARSFAYRILFLVRNIIGAFAIFMLVFSGFRLVTAGGEEEEISAQKKNIVWSLIGLVLVAMSGELATIFEGGTFFSGPDVIVRKIHFFDTKVQLIITFIKYILGSLAVVEMAIAGLRLITSGEKEEMVTKSKKNILYGAIGLLVVFIANIVVNRVIYRVDKGRYLRGGVEPGLSVSEGVDQIVGVTNLIVTIGAPLAILGLIIGAIMYLTALGEEEKMTRAKKLIFKSLIGLVVIYGAFAFVTTIVTGSVSGLPGAPEATPP